MSTAEIVKSESKQIAKKPADTFRDLLDKLKPQMQLALPKHVDINRMIRICMTTVQRNPDLLACTQESLLGCIFQCVQLGLEPDGLLGHAYLIPFNDNKNNRKVCTLIVGYKGLLKLARQSNEITSISARVVYSKDLFEYEFGLEDKLTHKPTLEEDPGEMTFAYAIFRYKGGGYHFDVMSRAEIEGIRKRSMAGKSGPWVTDYDEMAKKTVLRRASKMAPASIEDLARAVAIDGRGEAGLAPDLELQLPAADVPGSEPENQGRRMSLAKAPGPATDASRMPEDAISTGKPAEFVMATQADRKKLINACTEARVALADIVKRFGKATVEELSADQVQDGLRMVQMVTGEVAETGSAS
ncbi:MAG: recombination protein RecT [Myxococcales bacterium]